MPNLLTVQYGPEMLTVEDTTQRVLVRLLGRLPPSLYTRDIAEPSVQKVFSSPLAHEIALWLESATVVRDTTLLLRAMGSDLDRLLRDYGLHRYNQRPDATIRQAAIQILWKPHGTVHALDMLMALLVPEPHTVRRSGRQQWHGWIAAMHDVIATITYWSLNSQVGVRWALWVTNGTLMTSTIAPPGIDTTGASAVPSFVFLRDRLGVIWQLSVDADEELHINLAVPPVPLPEISEYMIVQDAMMHPWYFGVTTDGQTDINPTPPPGRGAAVGHGRILREPLGSFHRLGVTTDGQWETPAAMPPASLSVPAPQTMTWMHVPDTDGVLWYVGIGALGDFLVTDVVPRWGQMTEEPFHVLDGHGHSWSLHINPVTLDLSVVPADTDSLVVVDSGIEAEYFVLLDAVDVPWYFTAPGGSFTISPIQPLGNNVTPADGPFTWLRLSDRAGGRWVVTPDGAGGFTLLVTPPAGKGTRGIATLGDALRTRWRLAIADPPTSVMTSDEPPVLYTDAPTCYMLHDRRGQRWFWRIDPFEGNLQVSDVLWPGVLPQTNWGEVAWFRATTPLGAIRYVLPNVDGMPMVRDIPPHDSSCWGIDQAILLYDREGGRWQWRLDFDSELLVTSLAPSVMPAIVEGIHLRDLADATGHVHDAGTIATIRAL